MPDFSKGSTFNKDANFQGVKFGADAPLLETELNELQDIQTEARADIIRDSIPSGFVQLGELDFDYMLNNENCVKLKTDSVAYVNGYKINIPKDTVINIGKAPEKDAREDLLFLEVWKEEVTKDSQLTVAGGEGQASTSNNILDSRVNQETSRRVALKWRIRHCANVDYNKFPEGLGYYNGVFNLPVQAQGGNAEPLNYVTGEEMNFARISAFKYRHDRIQYNTGNIELADDYGIYLAGSGKSFSSPSVLKTLDGYVYAIPMFKLYRKPSCGKAIPFEYQKINPKVDYSKFTELMKEERVERVISETIQGQSLVILLNYKSTWKTTSWNNVIPYCSLLKENTKYTLIVFISNWNINKAITLEGNVTNQYTQFLPSNSCIILGNGVYKFCLTTKSSFDSLQGCLYSVHNPSETKGTCDITISILEGDWTNKPIPKYFTGLKSVGEDESLITVKNSILNESSYDPSTGTPKLNTVSGTNYISSDNLIMPTIEGQVKRGEAKVSDLTTFDRNTIAHTA